ncbi:MAG: response regulator [Planctomycetota bacterium]|nr:response regulator [Planctomycetota bacterium]
MKLDQDRPVWETLQAIEVQKQAYLAGRPGSLPERAATLEGLAGGAEELLLGPGNDVEPAAGASSIAWLKLLLADVRQEQGLGELGLELLGEARRVLVEQDDREGCIRAAVIAAEIHYGCARFGEAEREVDAGVDLLPEGDDHRRARIALFNLRARIATSLDDLFAGVAAYESAMALCEGPELLLNRARLTINLGVLHHLNGAPKLARKSYESALALCAEAGDEVDAPTIAVLQRNLAMLYVGNDEFAVGLDLANQARAAYSQLGAFADVASTNNIRLRALLGLGEVERAQGVADESLETLADWAHLDQAPEVLGSLAEALWQLGHLDGLDRVLDRLEAHVDSADASGDLAMRIWRLRVRGRRGGDQAAAAALPELEAIIEEAERLPDPNFLLDALEVSSLLHEAAGDLGTALDLQRKLSALQGVKVYEMMGRRRSPNLSVERRLGSPVRPQALEERVLSRMVELDAAYLRLEREEEARREAIERERGLEQDLQRALRLESLGRLAGGVAHDFNNLLTVIRGNAERITRGGEAVPIAREILTAAARGQRLVAQLLSFGRRQDLHLERLVADDVVAAMGPLLSPLFGPDLELDFALAAPAAYVRVDRAKLESVILNLLLNAREAMEAGGRVRLETELEPGGFVLRVRDEGIGIPAANQELIFDPFFTTRPEGEGGGMGLASALGIAQRLGGDLRLAESSRFGSVFELRLPLASAPAASEGEQPRPAPLEPSRPEVRLVGARILVVEDNEAIRRLVSGELERRGAEVEVAGDGRSGLERILTGEAPDLVVCDVIMPGMGGPELFRLLLERGLAVPFLFTSGYPDRWNLEEFEGLGRIAFLPKPFALESLAQRAAELLI